MSEVIVLKFQEAKQPFFREKKGEGNGYIQFGEDNLYPNYLLDLYSKSAKHGAITRNKAKYVIGNGFTTDSGIDSAFIDNFNANKLLRKVAVDVEVFGGSYLEIIWSKLGRKIVSVKHIDYTKIRTNEDNTQFWYKKNWDSSDRRSRIDAEVIPEFNPSILTEPKQIMYVKEYRPGSLAYALPSYIHALNYIESDVQVSKHTLGNAANGFKPTKLVTMTNGEATEDEMRAITRKVERKWSGSEGATFVIEFVNDASRKTLIEDLGVSALTKEDFTAVDNLIQSNIFAGHEITSPSLFGIAQPGKLGGSTELKDAYDIFKNTYANDKQRFLEEHFNTLSKYAGYADELKIIPVNPLTVQFTFADIASIAPREYLDELIGLDRAKYAEVDSRVLTAINSISPLVANKVLESMTPNEIRALAQLGAKEGADGLDGATSTTTVGGGNEALRSLTGRQHQQLIRIIRQVGQGKLTREAATVMLKSALGLNEEEINTMLGIDEIPEQMRGVEDVSVFSEFGESKENFHVVLSRKRFSGDEFELFAEVNKIEASVLDLIAKDKRVTSDVIAKTLRITVDRVDKIIESAIAKGYIDTKTTKVGSDVIEERKLTQPLGKIAEDIQPKTTDYYIRYSYEWLPEVPANERDTAAHPSRDFCRELMRLNKVYTREEIELISVRLGYSVWDRRGGWWNDNGDNKKHCRHQWSSQILIRKK